MTTNLFFLPFMLLPPDAGGGRNSAARKENGVSYSTGRGVTDTPTSLPVSQATKSDAKLAAK